uniref:carnosine N-methyltransferase n=1 Tax=Clastoptera arizonana TaxID=38151 RepID=A0A1B6CSN0_9HEMI
MNCTADLHPPPPSRRDPLSDTVEKEHFIRIISSFKLYRQYSLDRIGRNEQFLNTIPEKHQRLLQKYKNDLQLFKICVENNQKLLDLIIENVSFMFENMQPVSGEMIDGKKLIPELTDIEKVQSTLKQLAREWSSTGLKERSRCHEPIIDAIIENFPTDKYDPVNVKILVPGAGLGRLAYEIVKRGYSCEGNEFSLFMLFTSNFVLNKCRGTNIHHIYPWIHQFDNNLTSNDQMTKVSFPDVSPLDAGTTRARFTMIAGDFLEIYTEGNQWDCVATCFFIDCAANIVTFVESIYNILKPGGIWINLGPLLYHFNNNTQPESIEISYEDLKEVIISLGFHFQKEQIGIKAKYAQKPNSMLVQKYQSVFFVCRKPDVENNTVIDDKINSRNFDTKIPESINKKSKNETVSETEVEEYGDDGLVVQRIN